MEVIQRYNQPLRLSPTLVPPLSTLKGQPGATRPNGYPVCNPLFTLQVERYTCPSPRTCWKPSRPEAWMSASSPTLRSPDGVAWRPVSPSVCMCGRSEGPRSCAADHLFVRSYNPRVRRGRGFSAIRRDPLREQHTQIQIHFWVRPRSPKCNFWEPLQAKINWKETMRDLSTSLNNFGSLKHLHKKIQRGGALAHCCLRSPICSFQSILACRGSQKIHFGDLGLTQNLIYLVSFVT